MSRTLKRPMFKRGGTPNTGIMDGFGEDRVMAQDGLALMPQGFTAAEDEVVPTMTPAPTATTPVFTEDPIVRREYEDEPAFGLQDYMSLFKLGAGIAGAPGRGSGLGGVLAASSEPLQQFADEFAASSAAKAARKREFEQREDDRIDAARREQKGREFEQFQEDKGFERELELQKVKTQDELRIFDARVASGIDKTDYQRKEEDKNRIYNEMVNAKSEQEYNRLKEQYEALYQDTVDARNSLREQILDNDELMGDAQGGIGFRGDAAELVDDPKYKGMTIEQIAGELVNDYVEKTFKITVPSMPEFGEMETGQEPGKEPGQETFEQKKQRGGGFQEGGMVGQQEGKAPLTFEELRARLPREVSDAVVRLITQSEAALLDFAQIETQEDIARFNVKYNTDLQLPAQVA
jgi:hypothetical protein